jgi:protein phosphatase
MEDAAAQANAALRSPDPEKEMGTPLTAGLLFGRRLYMIHIGDSRAYLYTNDTLKLLTTDHSVVKALEEAGQITPEEAAIHPNRNLLYRALMGENLDVDVFSTRLPPEGKLIFCSDGLWGMISEEELAEILASSRSMSEMAEDLIEMAVATGGNDDITIVLVEFGL